MPATATAFNYCNARLYLADVNGVHYDISGMSNNVDLSFTRNIGDYVVFRDKNTWRLECKEDGSVTLTVHTTKDVNGAYYLIKQWWVQRGYRYFRLIAPEEEVGNDSFDGYFLLSEWSFTADASEAGPGQVSATLAPNGPINITTVTT